MKRNTLIIAAISAFMLLTANNIFARGNGSKVGLVIYVTSQGLFYDSIVAATSLPMKGPFQKLEGGAPEGANAQTEFGPGGPGYKGGRWWQDLNGNNEMDAKDNFFSCPLLGPGREIP